MDIDVSWDYVHRSSGSQELPCAVLLASCILLRSYFLCSYDNTLTKRSREMMTKTDICLVFLGDWNAPQSSIFFKPIKAKLGPLAITVRDGGAHLRSLAWSFEFVVGENSWRDRQSNITVTTIYVHTPGFHRNPFILNGRMNGWV